MRTLASAFRHSHHGICGPEERNLFVRQTEPSLHWLFAATFLLCCCNRQNKHLQMPEEKRQTPNAFVARQMGW